MHFWRWACQHNSKVIASSEAWAALLECTRIDACHSVGPRRILMDSVWRTVISFCMHPVIVYVSVLFGNDLYALLCGRENFSIKSTPFEKHKDNTSNHIAWTFLFWMGHMNIEPLIAVATWCTNIHKKAMQPITQFYRRDIISGDSYTAANP